MKDWGRHIQDWAGWAAVSGWQGWRRYAPAAGSAAAHVVVGAALVGMMAASVKPRPAPITASPTQLEVTLIAETPRPVPRPPPPRKPPPRAAPDADAIPGRPRATARKDEKRQPEAAPDENTLFVPPSIFADSVPLGLRGMASRDRCNPAKGLRPRDCSDQQWAEKIPSRPSWQVASKEELRVFYKDVMVTCQFKVGCEGGEWISTNGTRSVAGSPMAGGAAGLTSGAEGTTGRLGFNPDHTDPGFGD